MLPRREMSFMSNDDTAQDVIVADNDAMIRDILRSMLEGQGFNALQAIDGLEAIDYATRTLARLVILDYKMSKLDGLAACAQIRRLPGYAEVPIAILTAFDDKDTRAAAQQAGASEFFVKPFKTIDLLQGIGHLLGYLPDGGTVPGRPLTCVWKRQQEPAALYGEPAELRKGRRVLNICRR
jgi:two-component system chemotaxis response regulator CheY